MTTIVEDIQNRAIADRPRFAAGDRVRVHFRVVEGGRTRTQLFEGIVIKRQGGGARETFTVRKQSFGVGVERTFPLHSPKIERLEVAARGEVRRAKLYYLRDKVGKQARVAERRWGIADEVIGGSEEVTAIDAEGVGLEEAEPELNPEAEQPEDAEAEGAEKTESEEAEKAESEEAEKAESEEAEKAESEEAAEAEPEEGAGEAGESEGADDAGGDAGDPEEDEG